MSVLPSELDSIFEYQGLINFGSYGAVYKVIKRNNQKYYAMKVVTIDPEDHNSFKNAETELRILSELKSPYIVNLDSYFKIEDKVYMVIEYCENRDLLKAIADKKVENEEFDEDEIWKYFIQISFGLETLHTNGFIHRDIKPQNILLDGNKDVRLADFGLSRYLEASSIGGTPPFYSPRMCSGDMPAKESDIWALGCVLYYLCNLEDPFKGNKKKIVNEPHMPIKSQYSEELRYFVDLCLKKQRDERPTINEIISNEFIVNKAISLGIPIPTTSDMGPIYRNLFNNERENNAKLNRKIASRDKKIKNQKTKIEQLEEEIATKDSEIETFSKTAAEILAFLENCKKSLNENQIFELKNSIRTLITFDDDKNNKIFDYSKQNPKKKREKKHAKNQNIENQLLLNPQDWIQIKKLAILNKTNNPEVEQDFRSTCSSYENHCSAYNQSFSLDYQEYTSHYHQITSLYFLTQDKNNRTQLIIYDTESEREKVKILNTPEPLNFGSCIAQLPNGELFCFGTSPDSGITLIIDKNYEVRALPSSKISSQLSSAIFFNENVYCFGGDHSGYSLNLSMKFDLSRNRWIDLTSLPKYEAYCHSIIFKGNILISGFFNKNIWQYSVDKDSFTTIPYDFAESKRKILINVGRLYLIECGGMVYESEDGDSYNWKQVSNSVISNSCTWQAYCVYNKGGIYISTNDTPRYYKFDLSQKSMTILQ